MHQDKGEKQKKAEVYPKVISRGESSPRERKAFHAHNTSIQSFLITLAMSRPGHRRWNKKHQRLFPVGSMALLNGLIFQYFLARRPEEKVEELKTWNSRQNIIRIRFLKRSKNRRTDISIQKFMIVIFQIVVEV